MVRVRECQQKSPARHLAAMVLRCAPLPTDPVAAKTTALIVTRKKEAAP
jgi:hypothetical protein